MIVERKGRLLPFAERIDPTHTALVVIDMQNDFLHPEGVFGRLGYDCSTVSPVVDRLHKVLAAARRANLLIVFVRASYDEVVLGEPFAETLNRRGHKESHCREGTMGIGWFGGLEPRDAPNEVTVTKHRFSGLWGTPLDLFLRSNGIRTIVFTGTATSGCVESTARDAFFLDYRIVIPSDCVQDSSASRHAATLEVLGKVFATIVESQAVISVWENGTAGRRGWMTETKRAAMPSTIAEMVGPLHAALVLVDLQNDYCDPRGALGQQGEDLTPVQTSLRSISGLLEAARSAGLLVIHVRTDGTPLAAAANGSSLPTSAVGTWGAAFVEAAKPRAGEPEVVKYRVSPIPDSRLELLLRANRMRSVIIAGTATYGSVESTVRDLSNKDFQVVVPADCVAAPAEKMRLHEAALETIGLGFGTLTTSGDIRRAWRELNSNAA